MKAKFINEIQFERGREPKNVMDLGSKFLRDAENKEREIKSIFEGNVDVNKTFKEYLEEFKDDIVDLILYVPVIRLLIRMGLDFEELTGSMESVQIKINYNGTEIWIDDDSRFFNSRYYMRIWINGKRTHECASLKELEDKLTETIESI